MFTALPAAAYTHNPRVRVHGLLELLSSQSPRCDLLVRFQLGESCRLILRTTTSTSLLQPVLQSCGSQSPTSAAGTPPRPACHLNRCPCGPSIGLCSLPFAHRFLLLSPVPPAIPTSIMSSLITLQFMYTIPVPLFSTSRTDCTTLCTTHSRRVPHGIRL